MHIKIYIKTNNERNYIRWNYFSEGNEIEKYLGFKSNNSIEF
jgi:hypothetical protein